MNRRPGTAGLLHTVPALADTFHRRIAELAPELRLTHVAEPELLQRAIDVGVDEQVRRRVLAHVRHLVGGGADAVLVTCSSIAEAAEAAGSQVEAPVVRVDRAMAEQAVELAAAGRGRVTALATLESTLGPTGRLLERIAAGTGVEVRAEVVDGAARARASGDPDRHDRLVREAVRRVGADADVLVLAQASMAAAADGAGTDVPVLESVSTGSARLVELLGEIPTRADVSRDKC